jgi:hypothetical protein
MDIFFFDNGYYFLLMTKLNCKKIMNDQIDSNLNNLFNLRILLHPLQTWELYYIHYKNVSS